MSTSVDIDVSTLSVSSPTGKSKKSKSSSPIAFEEELKSIDDHSSPSSSSRKSVKSPRREAASGTMSPDLDTERSIDFNEDKYFGQTRIKADDKTPDEDSIVTMKNVHKTYLLGVEGVTALRGVSLTIKKGEFVCIFGTSGGGKTTMLNIMGTIDKPTKGELYIAGQKITSNTKDADLSTIRLKKIGFVFQTFNLLSSMTAQENVEMPMILAGELSISERKQRAKELLTMVGMSKRLDHFPSMLSGGEQQRVTIARAISNKPDVLLLDEPTGDLDSVNTLNVMKLLTDLNRDENITMIMVTHDVALKAYADRVVWMRDGKIQRIDITAKRAKREALEKLAKDLDAAKTRKKLKSHGTHTEIRVPHDYNTYKHHEERDVPSLSPEQ
jgi:putative ABC transport system ATP-binding protein